VDYTIGRSNSHQIGISESSHGLSDVGHSKFNQDFPLTDRHSQTVIVPDIQPDSLDQSMRPHYKSLLRQRLALVEGSYRQKDRSSTLLIIIIFGFHSIFDRRICSCLIIVDFLRVTSAARHSRKFSNETSCTITVVLHGNQHPVRARNCLTQAHGLLT